MTVTSLNQEPKAPAIRTKRCWKKQSEALIQTANRAILDRTPDWSHPEYISDADSFLPCAHQFQMTGHPHPFRSRWQHVPKTHQWGTKDLPSYVAIDSSNNNQGGQVVWLSSALVTDKEESVWQWDSDWCLKHVWNIHILNNIETTIQVLFGHVIVVESEPQAMMANSRNGDIIANIVMSLMNAKAWDEMWDQSRDFTTKVRTIHINGIIKKGQHRESISRICSPFLKL